MSNSAAQNPIVKLRPHFILRGNDLYFLASSRPARHLSESEAALIRLLADAASGIAFSALSREQAGCVDSMVKLGFADVIQPITPASEYHLVVVEPHMDDAILSVGGQMLLRKGKHRITILCMSGISNYTSYMEISRPFLDHQEVTRLRTEESRLAAAMVGAQFESLGFQDAPLRLFPVDEWSEQGLSEQVRMVRGFLGSYPIPHVVHKVELAMGRALQELAPDEVWIPMGLGHHVDHRTCRSACLRALDSAPAKLGQIPVRLYEDLPYSQQSHRMQLLKAFESADARLTLHTEDISGVMDQKLQAVGAFASQFKLSVMAPRLHKAAAEVAAVAGYPKAGERSYLLASQFGIPGETALATDRDTLRDLRSAVKSFSAKIASHKLLNILVLPSGVLGSISEVAAVLTAVFPHTLVMITVIGEQQRKAEFRQLGNGCLKRIQAASWFGRFTLVRELACIGTPTIIVSWGGQQGSFLKRALLKTMGASRSLLVAPSLSDICALWEEMATEEIETVHRTPYQTRRGSGAIGLDVGDKGGIGGT